jgi:peptide/nickel transport system substrate-binding protein
MSADREHPYVPKLKELYAERKCSRREFLRTATLLGVSATAAYGFAGRIDGEAIPSALAQGAPRKGGSLRLSARVREIQHLHRMGNVPSSNLARQTVEYLANTGVDNVTRPMLLESWQPSEDLKTWTLKLRRDVTWRKGRKFTAEDVVWNIKSVLDPKTGSSVLGLMKGYMTVDEPTDEKDAAGKPKMTSRLWDANAIEKVDDYTVRLNLKSPQLAVPEHFFHYPFVIVDPAEGGKFGAGINGTGPFELVEYEISKRAVLKPRQGYWGKGPYLDEVVFVDLGDDPGPEISAMASKQIHSIVATGPQHLPALKRIPGLDFYVAKTGATVHARMYPVKPFDDIRVIRAMRYAVDNDKVAEVTFGEIGYRAEHHHVSPVHPEYAPLPPFKQDVAKAKALLAEAGYPNGLEIAIPMTVSNNWTKDVATVLVQQWAEAGIKARLEVLPSPEWNKVWNTAKFACGDWSHRPLGIMCLALAYRTGVPWNESAFSNAEFDKVLDLAESTADVEKRRQHVKRLEEILQNDGPLVQPLFRSVFTFCDKKMKGFQMHPTQYIECNEIWLEA